MQQLDTPGDLADRIYAETGELVDHELLERIENCQVDCPVEIAAIIARALGCSIDGLVYPHTRVPLR